MVRYKCPECGDEVLCEKKRGSGVVYCSECGTYIELKKLIILKEGK